jgi:hypothetical protein
MRSRGQAADKAPPALSANSSDWHCWQQASREGFSTPAQIALRQRADPSLGDEHLGVLTMDQRLLSN